MLRLDPAYVPSRLFWWFNLGSVAVLFFFVLSGYVIGLSTRSPFSAHEARSYAARRLLRLAPVNTAAVLLSWFLLPQVALGTTLGNLCFLQNFKPYLSGFSVDVMPDNLNLWSLNFEALYYIAFMAIWLLAPRIGWVVFLLALASASVVLPGDHMLASCYALGALYWVAGLAVAWLAPRRGSTGNWPSAMLAVVVTWPLAPLQRLLQLAHVPDLVAPLPLPSYHRLDILPALVWLLLAVTGRSPLWQRRLTLLCLTWASAAVVRSLYSRDAAEPGAMVCYSALLAFAWAAGRWEPRASGLSRLAPLGAISYGIYAVAFPIQWGVYKARWLPVGDALTYTVRAAVLVGTTLGLAWLLERKVQPAIRRALNQRAP
jgi:peptidoglycan/LPS O-acetylase OafA/YrhL